MNSQLFSVPFHCKAGTATVYVPIPLPKLCCWRRPWNTGMEGGDSHHWTHLSLHLSASSPNLIPKIVTIIWRQWRKGQKIHWNTSLDITELQTTRHEVWEKMFLNHHSSYCPLLPSQAFQPDTNCFGLLLDSKWLIFS